MFNVFFYKDKAKQTVISICARGGGGGSTTTEIAHHKMFLSDFIRDSISIKTAHRGCKS